MPKIKCWRCNEEMVPFCPGIKIQYVIQTNMDNILTALIPQPICKSCYESFKIWCSYYKKEGIRHEH